MSWEDTLKAIPEDIRDKWQKRIGSKYDIDEPSEMFATPEKEFKVEIDESALREECCEQARNQLNEWISANRTRYEERGDKVKAENMDGLEQVIEGETCETVKDTFKSFIGFTKVKQQRSGKPSSDEEIMAEIQTIIDLTQIMDDWDKCEGGRE